MLIAQAMAEYGAMHTLIEAIGQTLRASEDAIRSLGGTTWAGGFFCAFVVWYVMSRRR